VATSLVNRAKLRLATGDPAAALADAERGLAIRENVLGPAHPYVAGALDVYADALRQTGDEAGAAAAADRAAALRAQ